MGRKTQLAAAIEQIDDDIAVLHNQIAVLHAAKARLEFQQSHRTELGGRPSQDVKAVNSQQKR